MLIRRLRTTASNILSLTCCGSIEIFAASQKKIFLRKIPIFSEPQWLPLSVKSLWWIRPGCQTYYFFFPPLAGNIHLSRESSLDMKLWLNPYKVRFGYLLYSISAVYWLPPLKLTALKREEGRDRWSMREREKKKQDIYKALMEDIQCFLLSYL